MPKGQRQKEKTHCPSGHPYSDSNTFISQGSRRCRNCAREKVIARRFLNRSLIQDFCSHPCLDCKQSFPTYVMQFDHLPQYEKLFCIAVGHDYGTEKLMKEIDKCEVVCANCHAERTWQRRNG